MGVPQSEKWTIEGGAGAAGVEKTPANDKALRFIE
jgi:hypothetical protein